MDLLEENIELIPNEELRFRYKFLKDYAIYLQTKVKELEKHLHVETLIRQRTPNVRCFGNYTSPSKTEIVRIPERKFYVYKPYIKDVKELINEYFGGE